MIEPLTIEAIAQACKGKLDAAPAIIAALIAFSGVVISVLVTERMNLKVRDLTRLHDEQIETINSMLTEARSARLAVHEAGLRVQAEVRLRLHEKSWNILRDLVEAVHACKDAFLVLMAAMELKSQELQDRKFDPAELALTRVVALATMSPPGTNFRSLSVAFMNLFNDINKIGKGRTRPQVEEALHVVFEAADASLVGWNRELWENVMHPIAKLEVVK